jgi:hypothetical protein
MPARPTPGPRPAPRAQPSLPAARPAPYRRLDEADVEPIRAPGIAALLRRHPNTVRRGAVGAIASGAVLFVAASLLTTGAGAAPAPHRASRPHVEAQPAHVPLGLNDEIALPSSEHRATPASAKKHKVKKNAPTDRTISSLASNGIPTVALNAYRVAAARMSSADPGCGIDWAMLAGIGRVESDHGRFAGAVLHSDGTSSPKIIGPALNGHGTALIPAPVNGAALDGDAVYTHALGPMQFIPQTWAGYGADADNDGRADIFDVDDAALGAARYLCAAGGNLRTQDGKVRAVMAYNHVTSYVAEVLALADAYRRGVPISGIPIGQLTGKLPAVKNTGTAANPGAPTAVGAKKPVPTKTGHPSGSGGSGSPTPSPTSSSHASSSSTSSHPSTSSSAPSSSPSSTPRPSSSSTSPSPSPSPSKTCKIHLGDKCIVR